jgi:creatinine amidohydrolase
VRAVSANGVLGDPAGASAAEGERLLARLVDSLSAAIDQFLGQRSA